MANPYTQGNPYLTQMADITAQQNPYQGQMQNTSMQDTFNNQALQQMQNQANQSGQTPSNPMALAMALRNMMPNEQASDRAFTPQQTWNMSYGTQAQPYQGNATYGVDAAQNYDYWK